MSVIYPRRATGGGVSRSSVRRTARIVTRGSIATRSSRVAIITSPAADDPQQEGAADACHHINHITTNTSHTTLAQPPSRRADRNHYHR